MDLAVEFTFLHCATHLLVIRVSCWVEREHVLCAWLNLLDALGHRSIEVPKQAVSLKEVLAGSTHR